MIDTVEKKYYEGEHTSYIVTHTDGQIWGVPLNPENRHYQEIQQWIADGGTVIDNPPE